MALLVKEDSDLLAKVLRVGITGSPGDASARATDPYVELTELAAELKAEAEKAQAEGGSAEPAERWADVSSRRSLIDRALVGRLSSTNAPVVDYLISSYRRCGEFRSRLARPTPEQEELLGYVSELCISYTSIALLNPSMFPQPPAVEAEGVLRLMRALRQEGNDSGLPPNFLAKLVARVQEDGQLDELTQPLIEGLQKDASGLTLMRDFMPTYRALMAVAREKPLAAALAADANWLPAGTGRTGQVLESASVLGPFLRLSCFPNDQELIKSCFSDISLQREVETAFSTMRMSLGEQGLQGVLFHICETLLKNKDVKEPFFKLVGAACSLNSMRAGQYFCHAEVSRMYHQIVPELVEQPAPSFVSSDGFMINLAAVFMKLCDPLTVRDSKHVSKIDASYMLSKHRLNLAEETRLFAAPDDVAYWLDPANPALRAKYVERCAADGSTPEPEGAAPLAVSDSFGTISEYFFLTSRLLHEGLLTSFTVLEQLHQKAHRWNGELEMAERELLRVRAAANLGPMQPMAEAQLQAQTDKLRELVNANKRHMLAYKCQVASPELLASAMRFYRLMARWLVQMANPSGGDLPLPAEPPKMFAALPEYLMDDIAQFFKQLQHIAPDWLENQMDISDLDDFLTLMITFINEPRYVKNPYLRATFTKLLRFLVPQTEENATSNHSQRLSAVFHTHALSLRHLAPAVMQFFVDIEFTEGAGGSGYEKYEFRHEMSQILEYLWAQPEYNRAMLGYARDTPRFVRFVNMLINDSIYAVDEALSKLKEIRDVQNEMADEAAWQRLPQRQRMARQQALSQDESHARYFMQFTNEVLHMLAYLSSAPDMAVVFMLPALCGRVASMLNYFLGCLVGPKSTELKVREPDKYFFHPKKLLLEIATTMTHFAKYDEFAAAVVRDERSYNAANMRKAIRVLSTGAPPNMPSAALVVLETLCRSCAEAQEAMVDEEEELGDIPDEYLDELTAELMTDPVRLPSGKVVDRATITRHLLSKETDPFSRQKLTIDQLVDAPDVLEQIRLFKEQKRKEAKAAKEAAPMDTE